MVVLSLQDPSKHDLSLHIVPLDGRPWVYAPVIGKWILNAHLQDLGQRVPGLSIGKKGMLRESILRKWGVGGFKDIARIKAYHMSVDGLEEVTDEFPAAFHIIKPLCLRLRKILFPLDKDERMSVGTPTGSPDKLYNAILDAYDETIHKLSKD